MKRQKDIDEQLKVRQEIEKFLAQFDVLQLPEPTADQRAQMKAEMVARKRSLLRIVKGGKQ